MNDIAKMRAEFERKIQIAELENEFESKGFETNIYDLFGKTHVCFDNNLHEVQLPLSKVREILTTFERTGDLECECGIFKYKLTLKCNYLDKGLTLIIDYIHNDMIFTVYTNAEDNALEYFMGWTMRGLTDSERSTYHNGRGARWRDIQIRKPFFNNTRNVINFQGGSCLLLDEEYIERVINKILEQ